MKILALLPSHRSYFAKIVSNYLAFDYVDVILIEMATFHIKQIGLAVCLMTSLLFGSASACTCPHHETEEVAKSDCHSHHDSVEMIESDGVDAECVCLVDQRTPAVISKSESKELKAGKSISNPDLVIPDLEFVGTTSFGHLTAGSDQTLSFSNAPISLLPARAPPRL